jgi:hypothetical protein
MENSPPTLSDDERMSLWFRLAGLLPLAFFLAQAAHYWRINELGHMLWMCNIGNLVLAIGLFLNNPSLIRAAVIWMFPGIAVWLLYVVLAWGMFLSSTMAHVGGLIVGIFAISKVGMDRAGWLYALGWYLFVQFLSRVFTPANLNVNVAHYVEPGWQQAFDSYWKFWLVLTILATIIVWTIGTLLQRIWPAKPTSASVFTFARKSDVG